MKFGPGAFPDIRHHAALFLWFVAEYLVFERVHLCTHDLVAERVGFKLVRGRFTFCPYLNAVGLAPSPLLRRVPVPWGAVR